MSKAVRNGDRTEGLDGLWATAGQPVESSATACEPLRRRGEAPALGSNEKRRTNRLAAIGAAVVLSSGLVLFGCDSKWESTEKQGGQPAAQKLSGVVRLDGSSTVFPISEAVAEEFQKANPGVKVTVGISGTGGGFKKFGAGEVDITNASRPIKPTEADLCARNGIEYIELPVAYDGLAVVVHPSNTWANEITVAELKRLWEPGAQGKILRWNQIRSEWPNKEIHLYGAGVDSGTYDYFTDAIVGKEGASRGDYTASEDDNVLVQGIARDELALGFFGLAYYEENKDKLKVLGVDDGNPDNGSGAIVPSVATVMDGTYQPLSRPLFIYINAKSLDKPEVKAFIEFYLRNAKTLTREVGYIPLPDQAYALAEERASKRIAGTLFGKAGSQVGVRIEELLAKEQMGK